MKGFIFKGNGDSWKVRMAATSNSLIADVKKTISGNKKCLKLDTYPFLFEMQMLPVCRETFRHGKFTIANMFYIARFLNFSIIHHGFIISLLDATILVCSFCWGSVHVICVKIRNNFLYYRRAPLSLH